MRAGAAVWRRQRAVYTRLDDDFGRGHSANAGEAEQPGTTPDAADAQGLIANRVTAMFRNKTKTKRVKFGTRRTGSGSFRVWAKMGLSRDLRTVCCRILLAAPLGPQDFA